MIVSLTILILTTFISVSSQAETATSSNLLPNSGDGFNSTSQHSNNNNTTIDSMGSASGFTLNGITDYTGGAYNELEAQGTGTVSASGSLVNLNIITENATAHTTTTTSLDGGVTLTSITEVQNCEWNLSSYRCGQATTGGGQRDTFSTTIKILDENNNVLAITTMNRNNDAGYRNNSFTYTDTATYTDTGSRNWSWEWEGVDGGDPSNTGTIGPNLLGASLNATLLNINYSPISEETEEQIEDTNELLEEAQLELENILENMEEVNLEQLEELQFETPILQEIEIEEIKFEELAVQFEETFKEILIEENLMPTFKTALIEEEITEEEFFEEVGNIIEEEFEELMPMPSMKEEEIVMQEPKMEEFKEEEIEEPKMEEVKEEEIANEPEVKEESPQEEVKEEVKQEEVKEESTETESNANTETTTKTEDTSEEPMESQQEGEPSKEESNMAENTEAEGSETETNNEETLDDKAAGDDKQETNEVDSVNVKVKRIIAKLEKTLKDVNDQVKAVQFVTLKGIQSQGANLSSYSSIKLNDTIKLNDGNPDFFNQLNIQQEQIYGNVNLNAYSNNDPITIKKQKLKEIDIEKQRLIYEIQKLKKG